MCTKQNRTFRCKYVHGDSRNKWIENINKAHGNINLKVENVIRIKSGIMINFNVSVKSIIYGKKITIWILVHVVAKIVNIKNIMYDSVITCDEIIDADNWSYNKKTKYLLKIIICKTSFYILLAFFLLITITLLIDVSI